MDTNRVEIAKDFIKWHIFRSSEGELTIPKDDKINQAHEALLMAIKELEKDGLIIITELSVDKTTIKLKKNKK